MKAVIVNLQIEIDGLSDIETAQIEFIKWRFHEGKVKLTISRLR